MPHHHRAPNQKQLKLAANELHARASALRELATKARYQGPIARWANDQAFHLAYVADWLALPYGTCDECGTPLQHFTSENVGGVLCTECDSEFVAEICEARDARRARILRGAAWVDGRELARVREAMAMTHYRCGLAAAELVRSVPIMSEWPRGEQS